MYIRPKGVTEDVIEALAVALAMHDGTTVNELKLEKYRRLLRQFAEEIRYSAQ
jgi:hypothetical protein